MFAHTSLSLVVGLIPAGAAGAQIVGPPDRLPWLPHPGVEATYVLTLTNTRSGIDEPFVFYLPGTGSASRPLVVGFHSFGVSPLQFKPPGSAAEVINQADLNDWYVVCPMGQDDDNMGVWKMQSNVEDVLEWVDDHYNVDHDHVYGIGFSMGGNWMMSYAARHLDPTRPMFAAVVNHTGGMSLTYTHSLGGATAALLEEADMLEGPPVGANLFGYLRSQSIDLDPVSFLVDQTNDMARNLTHVDIYNFHSDHDTLAASAHLKLSVNRFHAQMQLRLSQASATVGAGGGSTQLVIGPTMPPEVLPHSWPTLDIPAAMTWLSGQTRTIPTASGTPGMLCDRNGRWLHMDVVLDTGTDFAMFNWGLAAGQNRFGVVGSSNLAEVFIHSAEVGLVTTVPANPVILNLASADATSDTVRLDGFVNAPLVTPPTTNWSYDAATDTVTILTLGTFEAITLTPQ